MRNAGSLLATAAIAGVLLTIPADASVSERTLGSDPAGSVVGGDDVTTRPFGPARLTGFAALPAETFVPDSEPSGSALGSAPINGITAPFADQPVQGFSGIVRDHRTGTYEVLSDNGYGNKANSADFVLRIHRIAPDFRTGRVNVVGGFNLSDPDGHVPFALTRPDRILTGADFDPESFLRLPDSTYWIGDEFGPWLLHVDRTGRLLAPPVATPDVRAPENPASSPNLPSSKGLESIALSPDRTKAYPFLEGTVAGDEPGSLRMYEFDLAAGAYTANRWIYQLDVTTGHAAADAVSVDSTRLLVIERDGLQGDAARVKKIYLADKRDRDHDGTMDKTLVADLLNIANPRRVGDFDRTFRFPFFTIEALIVLDDRTLGVLNDNNFPTSAGRTPGRTDNNELITVRLSHRLYADRRVLAG